MIGAGSTALHLGLLAFLTAPLGAQGANLVGLVVSTVANTAANWAWTFQVAGLTGWLASTPGAGRVRHHLGDQQRALELLAVLWSGASTVTTVAVVARPTPSPRWPGSRRCARGSSGHRA